MKKSIRKPKIGLVGLMAQPFRGDKETYFADDARAMADLAEDLDAELKVVREGIYSFEDAQSAARSLAEWEADYLLVQSSSFAGGDFIRPLAALDKPIGLWGVPEGPPGPEGGLPLNSFTGMNLNNSLLRTTLKGYHHPVKWFFGRPVDPLFQDRFRVTVPALRALVNLRGAQIGLVGGVAPGFDNLIVDPRDFEAQLGIRIHALELDAVLSRARAISDAGRIAETAKGFVSQGVTLAEGLRDHLLQSARLQLAFEGLVEDQRLDALAVSCWPRFQAEPGIAVCSLVGQLNTLGLVTACEGDVPAAVAMLALSYLTHGQVVTLMDLVSVDPGDDTVLLWHCGPTSPLLADDAGTRMESLWLFDGEDGGRMGLHNDLVLKPGPVTLLGLLPDLSQILVAGGRIDSEKPSYKGSRGWLADITVNTRPVTVPDLVETLMSSGYQHHYPLAYGNLEPACLELGALLGIPAVQLQSAVPYLKG